MRNRLLAFFVFAVLSALTWMSPIAPVSTTVFAQQQGAQPAEGQQAAGARPAGPGTGIGFTHRSEHANIRGAAGGNAGVAGRSVYVEELL